MTETRREPEGFARRAAMLAPRTYNEAARTVDVVFTTGRDVERRDLWSGERWIESLDITADAMDLSRLNAGAPVLNAHDAFSLDSVIGVVERAWISNGQGLATIRFSAREDVAPIVADVQTGVLRNISVGYVVNEWRETEEDGVKRRTAARWQPMEISFVPIPADPAAQVRSAESRAPANPQAVPAAIKETAMTDQVSAAPAQPDVETIRAEAVRAERARVAEIRSAATMARLGDEWAGRMIEEGATPDAARRAALEALAAKPATPIQSVVEVTRDEGDTQMRGVEMALAARLGAGEWQGEATVFRAATLVDMAAATLRVRGVNTRGMSRSDIARAALGLPVQGLTRAGPTQTTSDFAALLSNVQSKRLLSAYMAFDRSFLSWAARRPLPDFKTTTIVEMGAAPALLALAEGGKIETGAIQDSGESYNLVRYARNVALSYPAIVNDDLGGFDRMPLAFAVAAANLENAVTYGLLETNANMSDGVALFAAGHNNTSAQAATVDGVSALRALIRRQTDPTGQRIMVPPSVVIVPVELEATMLALFSPMVVAATVATTAVNPWRGSFTIVASPFLTDTNDYYVTVGAGTGYEAVEVGYEAGNEAPQLTSYVEPDVDGVLFSMRHSFGAKAASWRTIARATA